MIDFITLCISAHNQITPGARIRI